MIKKRDGEVCLWTARLTHQTWDFCFHRPRFPAGWDLGYQLASSTPSIPQKETVSGWSINTQQQNWLFQLNKLHFTKTVHELKTSGYKIGNFLDSWMTCLWAQTRILFLMPVTRLLLADPERWETYMNESYVMPRPTNKSLQASVAGVIHRG